MNLEVITRQPEGETKSTPILFVHGAWHSAWCWDEYFLEYFAQHGYEAHALSLRGHGKSEGYERLRWHRIRDYVVDVAQVAGQLSSPPIVVGHSMGGLVVQKYLEEYKAPAGVLLAAVPVRGVWGATLRTTARIPLKILKANLSMNIFAIIETPELAKTAFFSDDIPTKTLEKYYKRLQRESYLGYLDMMFYLPKPARVTSPIMITGGADDRLFLQKEIEASARAFNTTAKIFPNMAHDMMLEKRWQDVADEVLSWLDGVINS